MFGIFSKAFSIIGTPKGKVLVVVGILSTLAIVATCFYVNHLQEVREKQEQTIKSLTDNIEDLRFELAESDARNEHLKTRLSEEQRAAQVLSGNLEALDRKYLVKLREIGDLRNRLNEMTETEARKEVFKRYNDTMDRLSCITGGITCEEPLPQ